MRFPCFSLSTRLSLVFVLTVCLIGLSLATPAVGVAGDDHARAITVDSHNNIIVTGYSYNSDSTESADFLTIKYETEGNFWGRRYNSPVDNQDTAEDVTLDSDDNVIVTGYSFFGGSADCVTIKYDSTGNWLWGRRYDGPANRGEMVRGVVVDASGNVVITCSSANADYNFDIVTIKYDANGNWVWGRRYNGPANDYDWASGLTVDASGNVYVTGSSSNGANLDYVTIKYSSSGAWIWGKRFNGPANGSDNAMDLAVDAAGNVYVTGASSNGGNDDYVTIKYNSSGNWVWGRRYNGPANDDDYSHALALDAIGNVVVGGRSSNGVNNDFLTIKYDTSGNWLWGQRYNGSADGDDEFASLVVDASDNVIITGSSSNGVNDDYVTIKYFSFGNWIWGQRYNGIANELDHATSMATDVSDNVIVTGFSSNGVNNDWVTIKYDPGGNLVWGHRYDGVFH